MYYILQSLQKKISKNTHLSASKDSYPPLNLLITPKEFPCNNPWFQPGAQQPGDQKTRTCGAADRETHQTTRPDNMANQQTNEPNRATNPGTAAERTQKEFNGNIFPLHYYHVATPKLRRSCPIITPGFNPECTGGYSGAQQSKAVLQILSQCIGVYQRIPRSTGVPKSRSEQQPRNGCPK